MSSLTILRKPAVQRREAVTAILEQQDPNAPVCHYVADLEVFSAADFALNLGEDGFVAWAGTLVYRGEIDGAAARRLVSDLRTAQLEENALCGPFACFVHDGEHSYVLSDWLGGQRLFRNGACDAWSTSFLATCAAQDERRLHPAGAWEYILHGACFGTDTPVQQLDRLSPEYIHYLDDRPAMARARIRGRHDVPGSLAQAASLCLEQLEPVFDAIATHWQGSVDSALSGGYDTRLILALLRARGAEPRLHVYGNATDPDVRVARQIATGERLQLEHTNKTQFAPADSCADIVRRNFFCFDALPPDGIYDNGADLGTRLSRMAGGHLLLNGGGGEIFRNFFYLPDRPFTAVELVRSFYSQFDPAACAGGFDLTQHHDLLAEKLSAVVGSEDGRLTRRQVELAYPAFRCRYWMAGNSSINLRLGHYLTPLVERASVEAALDVPLSFKNDGRLQAEMIRQIDPALAAYPSDYGHSFDRQPPVVQRAKAWLNRQRPLWLRERSFRIKQGLTRPAPALFAWSTEFAGCLRDQEMPLIRQLVIPEKLSDAAILRRAATLEYLGQELNLS